MENLLPGCLYTASIYAQGFIVVVICMPVKGDIHNNNIRFDPYITNGESVREDKQLFPYNCTVHLSPKPLLWLFTITKVMSLHKRLSHTGRISTVLSASLCVPYSMIFNLSLNIFERENYIHYTAYVPFVYISFLPLKGNFKTTYLWAF